MSNRVVVVVERDGKVVSECGEEEMVNIAYHVFDTLLNSIDFGEYGRFRKKPVLTKDDKKTICSMHKQSVFEMLKSAKGIAKARVY